PTRLVQIPRAQGDDEGLRGEVDPARPQVPQDLDRRLPLSRTAGHGEGDPHVAAAPAAVEALADQAPEELLEEIRVLQPAVPVRPGQPEAGRQPPDQVADGVPGRVRRGQPPPEDEEARLRPEGGIPRGRKEGGRRPQIEKVIPTPPASHPSQDTHPLPTRAALCPRAPKLHEPTRTSISTGRSGVWWTIRPFHTVPRTCSSPHASKGSRTRSWLKMTRSATFPGSRLPFTRSSPEAYAAPVVYPSKASCRVSRSRASCASRGSSAWWGSRRVRAAYTPRSGSGLSTGASEPKASRAPAARSERQAWAHWARSGPQWRRTSSRS